MPNQMMMRVDDFLKRGECEVSGYCVNHALHSFVFNIMVFEM